MSLKKPRSDSKLDALDVDQQRQLCEWLLTPGLSYEVVKKMVLDEFNTSTSARALSSFYQSYVAAYLIQRRAQAVGVAKELHGDMEKTPGKFDEATIDALSQKAFEFAQNPMVDPRDVKQLFSLVLKARDQSLKEQDISIKLRRLELLEKSSTQAKEKLTALTKKGGLSADALKEIERAAKILS
jgi:hypothetical protein